jgi:hypothetical protein
VFLVNTDFTLIFLGSIAVAAILYSSVGHGGAYTINSSAYKIIVGIAHELPDMHEADPTAVIGNN